MTDDLAVVKHDSDEGSTSGSEPSSRASQTPRFTQRSGQFLHDFSEEDTRLVDFANRLCAMNVYRVFFDYTTVLQADVKQPALESARHTDLNRYIDIRCLDATRVKVKHPTEEHDYIHASYVDGFRERRKFILTQAPLERTVDQFWAMVWQERAVLVVSLTIIDGAKCARYLPTRSAEALQCGALRLTHAGTRHVRDSYDATVLMVTNGSEAPRKILHIVFYRWPDKGTPTRPTEILNLVQDINFNRQLLIEEAVKAGWLPAGSLAPVVVHCLAGAGRSGALTVVDICCQKLDETGRRAAAPLVDVRDTVMRLRSQREMAVQKPEQYLFVHLVVLEYALRQRHFDSAERVDVGAFIVKLEPAR